ncbi:MAG: hypothetical protein GC206_04795 [Alphaproteobacteria bacterium]|nr:hypothetical protein [Alphaproteobacteria bacterium]
MILETSAPHAWTWIEMPTLVQRAPAREESAPIGARRDGARAARIEAQLKRFRPGVQLRVRALASRHPRLADLACAFPALLVALAFPRARADARGGIDAIIAGAPLAEAAARACTPLWLRKAPPEAFAASLPLLPDGRDFRRRIANHVPQRWRNGPVWLNAVANLARWAGEAAALWIARELSREFADPHGGRRFEDWRLFALWIWHSGRDGGIARALIDTPFDSAMRLSAANAAAYAFREGLLCCYSLAVLPVEDPWLPAGERDGYAFVPLLTADAIVAEARAMNHCVRNYGEDVALNRNRLYSIRHEGARVATMRLYTPPRHPLPQIAELQGPDNHAAPIAVWLAARRFVDSCDPAALELTPRRWDDAALSPPAWRALWREYWLAMRRVPDWLPLAGTRAHIHAL